MCCVIRASPHSSGGGGRDGFLAADCGESHARQREKKSYSLLLQDNEAMIAQW